jgi:hypothetical protein
MPNAMPARLMTFSERSSALSITNVPMMLMGIVRLTTNAPRANHSPAPMISASVIRKNQLET